ncbi:thioredoxin family protein [Candidatus Woesearchaeota archaeon]|nr:thioredoxin family protein [Candidatus Woesearchaeota archaeon]
MKKYICMLLVAIIFLYGCSSNLNQDEKGKLVDTATVKNTNEQNNNLKLLAGAKSPYYRFDKAHFENSLQQNKIIFLDFHADWCPICLQEKPDILAAFNELNNDDVVGYQVYYNDGQTTEDDKEMAKKYGITYQHTKAIINKDGEVVSKSLEVFSKEKVINEINKAIMG